MVLISFDPKWNSHFNLIEMKWSLKFSWTMTIVMLLYSFDMTTTTVLILSNSSLKTEADFVFPMSQQQSNVTTYQSKPFFHYNNFIKLKSKLKWSLTSKIQSCIIDIKVVILLINSCYLCSRQLGGGLKAAERGAEGQTICDIWWGGDLECPKKCWRHKC